MFIDQRNKDLAVFRAHRTEKKEIAILAKKVTASNPDKTHEECRVLAKEIRAARQRDEQRQAIKTKGKGKCRTSNRSHSAPCSSQCNYVITKVSGMTDA